MDEQAFLDWLEAEQDGGYILSEKVHDEWPEFFEHYSLVGVTVRVDEQGRSLVPVRDYRDCIRYGQPLD